MTLSLVEAPQKARRGTQNAPRRPVAPPEPFTLAHFRAWAAGLVLDSGESWSPEPFQDAFVSDLFTGTPECWLVVPEGNGKTTLLAGVALYHCEFHPFAVVPVAAASREQAEIIYRQAEGFVLRSPRMYASTYSAVQAAKGKRKTDVPRFTCLEGYRRINHVGGGRIQVFAADDRTGDGVIPTLGIIDEPHRQRDLSLYRTWSGKLTKRKGQLVAISTAGEPGSDFEVTRQRIRDTAEQATRKGSFLRVRSGRIVMHEWALPDGADQDDIKAVKSANPFSGVTTQLLKAKLGSPTMTPNHWLRMVCNRPARDYDTWLGPDGDAVWAGCTDPYALVDKAQTWAGVDVGLKRDSTAVVVAQHRPDGRIHLRCKLWIPTPDRPIDVTDVMQYIRELAERYALQAVSYDPTFFDVAAKMLADEGLPMENIPQAIQRMTQACGDLYAAVKGGRITHDDDTAYTTQVMNAQPRWNEHGFMFSKGKSVTLIDAAVASALAVDRVLRSEGGGTSVYDERDALEFG